MLHEPIQLSLQNKFRDQIMKNFETIVVQPFTRLGALERPQVTAMKLALDSLISLFHPVHLQGSCVICHLLIYLFIWNIVALCVGFCCTASEPVTLYHYINVYIYCLFLGFPSHLGHHHHLFFVDSIHP